MVSPSPLFTTAAAGCGLDFVFLDTEHIPLDRDELAHACMAYKAHGLPPLVRIPKADAVLARQVLDAGACGVVASYMETVEQVIELKRAVKLKPLQGELLKKAIDDPERFEKEHVKTANEVAKRNAPFALVINVESKPAIENLEKMLSVPGVDAVLVGPHDLSFNLGVPEDFENPIFQEALRSIFTKARAAGVGAGIHNGMPPGTPGMTPEYAKRWVEDFGCNVYVHGADVNLFAAQLKRDLASIGCGNEDAIASTNGVDGSNKRIKISAGVTANCI
eukprot:gnl/MRDRNA2_/MRDRNA2_165477_c0_seq1.p1 gnl/MRDRNA2_/MRDRNA2_165477_c0~~gnl/MRDRNA2_/MRDRNA2_165477_c0_seq1.p1  ORF type:complete len:277 (-),score=60.59 gnl/MRDRNA2_/MRDRNA2_165477_c0_seq1:6-836(-)